MELRRSFQEQIPNNHCFGCGPQNHQGLKIQSYWNGENQSVCDFTPLPHHSAGPLHFLNGGIISTIIDCHCVCTAIAKGYLMRDREIGQGELVWFATGNLEVNDSFRGYFDISRLMHDGRAFTTKLKSYRG